MSENPSLDKDNTNKVTIYIDDVAHQVSSDDNLLAGVLSEKLNLPYFCWHPSMGSVGACRQCAVTQFQDENDTRGRMVMSCMTPVKEGMRIGLKDKASEKFREQVIGAMMTNHPHDCPVCAEGGECHLQDMTVMTGHTSRDYQGSKRTFTNQHLGELVGHEMNRCITCYRCVRFYKDYAGGEDFDVYGSANHVYFGRQTDGELESEFSGNLVEVCPTGVFTNKLFSAHYTRKWDLQSAPSVCAHCSVGCNTSIGERYGSVRRVVNRFNHDINGYFLCDRGRYGIGFVNSDKRIRQSKGIKFSSTQLTNLDLAKSLVHFRGEKFIAIGSERTSLEANFYLQQLVGKSNFSSGLSKDEMMLAKEHQGLLHRYKVPSLAEVEQSDLVIIIGEDITQTSPRMALSVRQALRNKSFELASAMGIPSWQDAAVRTIGGEQLTPLFSLNSVPTKLDGKCKQSLILSPELLSHCLSVINTVINASIDNVTSNALDSLADSSSMEFVKSLVSALLAAKNPLIISGWSLQSTALFSQISQLMATLHGESFIAHTPDALKTRLAILPRECNSIGLFSIVDEQSLSIEQVLDKLITEEAQSLILLEQELGGFSKKQLDLLRENCQTLIVLDHSESAISELADIVLPVAAVSEGNGHYVNYQGLVQRYHQVHAPILPIQDSWRWLDSLANCIFSSNKANKANKENVHHHSLKQLNDSLHSQFENWPIDQVSFDSSVSQGIARQTHRSSGRTSQMANISVHESKTTQSQFDDFNFSMEGKAAFTNDEMPFTWAPGWNSNQSINQYQTQVGKTLIKRTQGLLLTFDDAMNTASGNKSVENTKHVEVIKPTNKTDDSFVFVNQITWHQGDWQTRNLPEFSLLHKANIISLSAEYVAEQHWQNGQYLMLSFVIANEKISTLAILQTVTTIPAGLAFGQIKELSAKQSNLSLSLSLPTKEQVTVHKQKEGDRLEQAKVSKANILAQLKINDQTIPIRLVSGGLDDV